MYTCQNLIIPIMINTSGKDLTIFSFMKDINFCVSSYLYFFHWEGFLFYLFYHRLSPIPPSTSTHSLPLLPKHCCPCPSLSRSLFFFLFKIQTKQNLRTEERPILFKKLKYYVFIEAS